MKLNRTATAVVAGSAAIALVLAGCSTDDSTDATASSAARAATPAPILPRPARPR